jgi:hypothetical protein
MSHRAQNVWGRTLTCDALCPLWIAVERNLSYLCERAAVAAGSHAWPRCRSPDPLQREFGGCRLRQGQRYVARPLGEGTLVFSPGPFGWKAHGFYCSRAPSSAAEAPNSRGWCGSYTLVSICLGGERGARRSSPARSGGQWAVRCELQGRRSGHQLEQDAPS